MRFFLFLLGLSCSFSVSAAKDGPATVYKCADAEGNVSYQKQPCRNLKSAAELNVTTGSSKHIVDEHQQVVDEYYANMTEAQRREAEKLRAQSERKRLLDQSAEQAQKNQEYLKNNKQAFSPYAIPPYQGKRYADIVENFLKRLTEIEHYRKTAAIKVLASGQCKRVEAADLVPKSSLEKLKFQVDCRNGKRIRLNEQELQEQEPEASQDAIPKKSNQ